MAANKLLSDVLAWLGKQISESAGPDQARLRDLRARVARGDAEARQEALTAMADDQERNVNCKHERRTYAGSTVDQTGTITVKMRCDGCGVELTEKLPPNS